MEGEIIIRAMPVEEIRAAAASEGKEFNSQRAYQISDEDAAMVAAYHAAPESVRRGIDALLAPYKEQESK